MRRALALAQKGEGHVEPNPMVGAVIVDEALSLIGEGYHQAFGGPHAEVYALAEAGERARGATLYVTLEPCCHHGKTPPCVDAILTAGIARVVVAMVDPFPRVAGGGIAKLREAGVVVEVGLMENDARELVAPFVRLVKQDRPWVHAKWAMTLDGKIAAHTGHSRWISNESSRAQVHQLRGRMDAIAVGIGTALADDPLLTARPPGPRQPLRVVFDRHARLPLSSQLVRTVGEIPVLVVCGPEAPGARVESLRTSGVEVLVVDSSADDRAIIEFALRDLGRRGCTNLLVEGGSRLLGSFFDAGAIDEVHAFVAPTLVGGATAPTPLGGTGLAEIGISGTLVDPSITIFAGDVCIRGRLRRPPGN
jgi:diaminohydroxyphosphoribosylaminopyrimidine deaminase/5-amino-6-(5-phosphoribosylamino)uracil reductase